MKKIIVVLVMLLLISTPVFAGLFSTVATGDWPTEQVEVKYKLSTYGYDVRVYEWTPKYNKNVRCVFVAGNENSSGTACYDVEPAKKK